MVTGAEFYADNSLVPNVGGVYSIWGKISDLEGFYSMWRIRKRFYDQINKKLENIQSTKKAALPEINTFNSENSTLKEGYILLYIGIIGNGSNGLRGRIKAHIYGAMTTGSLKLLGTSPSAENDIINIAQELNKQDFEMLTLENIEVYYHPLPDNNKRKRAEAILQNDYFPLIGKIETLQGDVSVEELINIKRSLNLVE